MDKTSYAVGLSFGQHLAQSKIKGLDYQSFAKGVEAMCEGKQPEIDLKEAQELLNKFFAKLEEESKAQFAQIREEGEKFLEENAKRANVVTLPSGLQYEIITETIGQKPVATDKVKVHYHGTLIDGTVFDSSVRRGEPATFGVTQVIQGWVEALQLMPVGSKWKLYIPYDLAYGEQGAGQMIAPFSTLIFEVELLEIVK
jgi:FKBP-type peptidyl-prolyl cis-trans isomerase FklB